MDEFLIIDHLDRLFFLKGDTFDFCIERRLIREPLVQILWAFLERTFNQGHAIDAWAQQVDVKSVAFADTFEPVDRKIENRERVKWFELRDLADKHTIIGQDSGDFREHFFRISDVFQYLV